MFRLETISDDEIDYFFELKNNPDFNYFKYLSFIEDDEKIVVSKKNRITANIATQPNRFDSLLSTIKSIEGQFDEIRLYLNNYDFVPDELRKYTTYIGNDITDNGKFFWSNNDNEYYFTLDDDIIYPPDYVEKTLPNIGNRIVSYHGRVLIGKDRGYYDKHKIYKYNDSLSKEKKLDVMGTGVSAFDTNFFKPTIWRSSYYKMTDLIISFEAHVYNIPIISPIKERNWISYDDIQFESINIEMSKNQETLNKWSNMIQEITKSNIDLNQINYLYDDESISKLSVFIKNKISEDFEIINLRSGNGNLINRLSEKLEFKKIKSYDTDSSRIKMCKDFIKNINFYSLSSYSDLNVDGRVLILLDDFKLSKSLSTQIFNTINSGVHFICHNFVNDVLPDDSLKLKTDDGEYVDFFYYIKK